MPIYDVLMGNLCTDKVLSLGIQQDQMHVLHMSKSILTHKEHNMQCSLILCSVTSQQFRRYVCICIRCRSSVIELGLLIDPVSQDYHPILCCRILYQP